MRALDCVPICLLLASIIGCDRKARSIFPGGQARDSQPASSQDPHHLLKNTDPIYRKLGVERLARDPKALPQLVAAMGDPDPLVAGVAASAVANQGGSEACQALLNHLDSPQESVRHHAYRGLAQHRYTSAIPTLIDRLEGRDAHASPGPVMGLEAMKADSVRPLLEAVRYHSRTGVRLRALQIARNLAPREARQTCLEALRVGDTWLVSQSYEFIWGAFTPEEEKVLIDTLNSHGSLGLAQKMMDTKSRPALMKAAQEWALAHQVRIELSPSPRPSY